MIKWDRPCYKCLSHFCDLSCKEPKHLQASQSKEPEQEPVATLFGSLPVYDTTTPQRTEQEPVAYSGNGSAGREADVRPTGFFFQMPQRTWVGLTDEERNEIANKTFGREGALTLYTEAIEAKLKEKNT